MHNMKFIEIALKEAVLFQRKKTVCFMILDPLKVYFIYPHLASIVLQYYFCACFVLLRAILAHAWRRGGGDNWAKTVIVQW